MAESLREACATGNRKAVEYYLAQGVNVNSANKVNLFTPLHWANSRGHDEIINLLLMNGADPNQKDSKGRIPADLYNPKPFQDAVKAPSYIEQPDLQKLWGVPAQQQQNEEVAVVESAPALARVKSEKAAIVDASEKASIQESATTSPSASVTLSRKVSFMGNLYDQETDGGDKSKVNQYAVQSKGQVARTASPEHPATSTSSSSRSGSVEWDDGKKISSSKRSSFRRSVSFIDAGEAPVPLVDSGSAAPGVAISYPSPEKISKIVQNADGEPSKSIDGNMKRSSPTKPLTQVLVSPEKSDLTEVLVFRDFKSQMTLRGSIFVSDETSLLDLHSQLIQEIDDMPADFILQKERGGIYIPINRLQLMQSAALHFRNSNLIYTSDTFRNIS